MQKYEKLNRRKRRYFSGFFTDTPITCIQALILYYIIAESKKRDIFPKDLEEFLAIKGSSVTSLIRNLERNGYLRRESLASDGRYKKLVLTEQALAIQDDITECIETYLHSMFAGISEDDLKVFEKVIIQMTENAQ
ncbi:MarR family transcriptional regulator [[Clostridium] symbiosum]|nr:MarR family transcriptional regulator [[Clostridium] symbiosum]MCB6609824.1 MarR family transcriptional regulator [[Clostridium] symbiosum]MCB6933251.1 MarR family transcriptional regulator [[Clostridium] symbiosum]